MESEQLKISRLEHVTATLRSPEIEMDKGSASDVVEKWRLNIMLGVY